MYACKEGGQLSFSQFASLLERPPFEPCESELEFLTDEEYERYFTQIMRVYFRHIRNHIAYIIGDSDAAPDIAQEVFLNLYKARASFDAAYIYHSAKNAAYGELRRRTRQKKILYALRIRVNPDDYRRPIEVDPPDAKPLQDTTLFEQEREQAVKGGIFNAANR